MNADNTNSLIKSLETLVHTNGILAETQHTAISLVERREKERDRIIGICKEIYEGLSIKEKRSVAEEGWYAGLQQILQL